LPLGIFIARFSRTVPFLRNKWFIAHWCIQLVFAGPIIIAGWVIGHRQVPKGDHFNDNHRRVGLALLVLYIVQISWGAFIHFVKPKPKPLPPVVAGLSLDAEKGANATPPQLEKGTPLDTNSTPSVPPPRGVDPLSPAYHPSSTPAHNRYPAVTGRPLQNYGHALNGLVIIALAFHNVRQGYQFEWEYAFGLAYTPFLQHINNWWISWVIIIPCIYVAGLTLLPRQWRQEEESLQQRSHPQ